MQTEREQFRDFRDLNKDGRLDGSEVGHWVLPPAQDQPLVEANHLLHESDTDKVRIGSCCAGVAGLTWSCPEVLLDQGRMRKGVVGGKGWWTETPHHHPPRMGGRLRLRDEFSRQGPCSLLLPSDPPGWAFEQGRDPQ